MRTQPLVVAALLLGVLVAPQASAGCTHLLIDPLGDVASLQDGGYPPPADDAKQVDLQWVELRSTKSALVATIKVADLNPESQPLLDHYYDVGFSNGGQRYELSASFNRTGNQGEVWHIIAGSDVPEDSDTAGASAGEGIGAATGSLDRRRDTITVTADLSVFAKVKPLTGSLTVVRAISWSGASAQVAAAYGSDDFGRTAKAYRLGARSCST